MKSIYNENLCPTDEVYQSLEDRFNQVVLKVMQDAQGAGLNLREVSHELTRCLHNIESGLVIQGTIIREKMAENNAAKPK